MLCESGKVYRINRTNPKHYTSPSPTPKKKIKGKKPQAKPRRHFATTFWESGKHGFWI